MSLKCSRCIRRVILYLPVEQFYAVRSQLTGLTSNMEGIKTLRRRQHAPKLQLLLVSAAVILVIVVFAVYDASYEKGFRGGRISSTWSPRVRRLYLEKQGVLGVTTSNAITKESDVPPSEPFGESALENQDVEDHLESVTENCEPRDLVLPGKTRQFAHLHHMKTGGTSFNGVIRCALERARSLRSEDIPFYSLSECGWDHFHKCLGGEDPFCSQQTDESVVMQYCAPLFAVNHFGWIDADLVTILRDPVDRVWSMYRFQTRSCYKCLPLKEIYQHIDNGTTSEICGECASVCMMQLVNHLTRNMLMKDPMTHPLSDEEMLAEAKSNLYKYISLVGVTEDIATVAKMVGKVFPWLNETVEGSDVTCPWPHSNSSPSNNGCGEGGSHLPLPDHPDEETRDIILQHNRLDRELYEEAKRMFELQKKVLGLE